MACWLLAFVAIAGLFAAPANLLDTLAGCDSDIPVLGDLTYDYERVTSPAADGPLLQVLSWLLTKNPFSPAIRRILLINNRICRLSQLARQQPFLPPLRYPMARLSMEEDMENSRKADEAAREGLDRAAILRAGLGPAPDCGCSAGRGGSGDEQGSDELPAFVASRTRSRVKQYHDAYRTGASDPLAAMVEVVEWMDAVQAEFAPFESYRPLDILAQARASKARWQSEEGPISIFDGVPIVVKPTITVRGHAHTMGVGILSQRPVSDHDDPLVQRFRSLGAIILGLSIMTEGGVSPLGYNPHWQGPHNPFNVSHFSGGSSGGSAVAVALGICPVAIGFDGGGSVRTPASFSGVFGLAHTWGSVVFGENNGHPASVVITGPLATTVEDAAIASLVFTMGRTAPATPPMAGGATQLEVDAAGDIAPAAAVDGSGSSDDDDNEEEPAQDGVARAMSVDYPDHFYREIYGTAPLPAPHLHGINNFHDLTGVRIGIFEDYFNDASPAVVAACRAAVDRLAERGAELVPVAMPNLGWLRMSHAVAISGDFGLAFDEAFTKNMAIEPATRITVGMGRTFTSAELMSGDRLRRFAFRFVTNMFRKERLDVMVSPTLSLTAPVIPDSSRKTGLSNVALSVEMLKYVFLSNLVGVPAMSVPVGHDYNNAGMPIGLMVTAKHWHESDILRVARAVELDTAIRTGRAVQAGQVDAFAGAHGGPGLIVNSPRLAELGPDDLGVVLDPASKRAFPWFKEEQ